MTRYVLGLNAFHGDAAACLLADGQVVMAVEEERLNRVKHCAGFPTLAARLCLQVAGIGPGELDSVAISRRPAANLHRKVMFSLGRLLGQGGGSRGTGGGRGQSLSALKDRLANAARVVDVRDVLAQSLDCPANALPKVQQVEHHVAHLASTYHASGFDEAALLSIDGFGDFVSTKLGHGSAGRIEVLSQVEFPHSAGILYTAATQFLGFPHYGDEGKVMGLAAYGRPTLADEMAEILRFTDDGFELDLRYFRHHSEGVEMSWDEGSPRLGTIWSDQWACTFGPARQPGAPLAQRDQDLAASLQHHLERLYAHLLIRLHERTGSRRVCIAGGVAYNSVANGKVRSDTPFEDVYIVCAAGDSGTALGAAYVAHAAGTGAPRPAALASAFVGPSYDEERCRRALAAAGLEPEALAPEDTCARTARGIAAGEVVGWFQGRVEFGPRALGNRSIVADPRRNDMKDILNARIKHREAFRPFAPSVLAERAGEWFEDSYPSPDMLIVQRVRAARQAQVPAITHADGTARVQTVSQDANPRYHALISAFAAETGVPMVLNTSFNENEPVVCTPEDAVACFLKTGMDVLVLGNLFVRRPG